VERVEARCHSGWWPKVPDEKARSGQDGRQDRERWNQLPLATPGADPAVRLGRVLPVGTHRGHGVGVEPRPGRLVTCPWLSHITDLAPVPTHLPGHDSLLPLATVDSLDTKSRRHLDHLQAQTRA
jgi:hypothetical protein